VCARRRDLPTGGRDAWFNARGLARAGRVSRAGLAAPLRQALKQQALAVTWKVDGQGRCQVEKKEEVKKRLGRSPDDLDALNLAYLTPPNYIPEWIDTARRPPGPTPEAARERLRPRPGWEETRRRLYGR